MMNNWYKVEIRGRHDGKPLTLTGTVYAPDATAAVLKVVGREFDGAGEGEDSGHGRHNGKVYFWWEYTMDFNTEHASVEEMATEIVDPAVLARLNGHPELPLVMDAPAPAKDGRR